MSRTDTGFAEVSQRGLATRLAGRWSLIALQGVLLALVVPSAFAQQPGAFDTLFLARGERIVGRIVAIEGPNFRIQKPLPPPPGAMATSAPVFATVTIPRLGVSHIEFAPDPARDRLVASAGPERLAEITALWDRNKPFLAIERSPAGTIGIALGNVLLQTKSPANAQRALDLFTLIETGAWDDTDQMTARPGRLRAMVATGRAADAAKEADELARVSEDPAVLIEAKFILAQAADKALRQLEEDNPRWREDIHVIPERARLYNEALDLYLFPALFFGSDNDAAARGLAGAMDVYRFASEPQRARETARDLVMLYPTARESAAARSFLDSLPDNLKNEDNEKDAQQH